MVGFRVDANESIASGHLMRCMAIALQCREIGCKCRFYLAENKMTERLDENNLEYTILNSKWDDLESEKELMKEIIRNDNIEVLVVDSYQASDKYLSDLNNICPVVYMDDMEKEIYHVNSVIHYGQWVDEEYINKYKDTATRVYMGPEYIPLRKEFADFDENIQREKIIFLTTGGSDVYNVTGKVLESMIKDTFFDEYIINVIVGKFNEKYEEIKNLVSANSNIIVFNNISNMSYYMRRCAVAVSAGGTTLYELCATKTPTVCFSFADNQEEFVKRLQADMMMISAGDARYEDNIAEKICDGIKKLLSDNLLKETMIKNMSEKIDGQGTKRIAQILKSTCKQQ